jgi:hypothetical protein
VTSSLQFPMSSSFLSSSFWRATKSASCRLSGNQSTTATRSRYFHQSVSRRNVAQEQQYKAKQTARLTPTMILLGITPLVTFALGTWHSGLDCGFSLSYQMKYRPSKLLFLCTRFFRRAILSYVKSTLKRHVI